MDKISSVPLLDLKAQYKSIKEEVEPAVKEVMESQYFILGRTLKNLKSISPNIAKPNMPWASPPARTR